MNKRGSFQHECHLQLKDRTIALRVIKHNTDIATPGQPRQSKATFFFSSVMQGAMI